MIDYLLFLVTLNSSNSIQFDELSINKYLFPDRNIEMNSIKSINDKYDWEKNLINVNDYASYYSEKEKNDIIIEFIRKISQNSVSIENDIVKMVNENFWDLA